MEENWENDAEKNEEREKKANEEYEGIKMSLNKSQEDYINKKKGASEKK